MWSQLLGLIMIRRSTLGMYGPDEYVLNSEPIGYAYWPINTAVVA